MTQVNRSSAANAAQQISAPNQLAAVNRRIEAAQVSDENKLNEANRRIEDSSSVSRSSSSTMSCICFVEDAPNEAANPRIGEALNQLRAESALNEMVNASNAGSAVGEAANQRQTRAAVNEALTQSQLQALSEPANAQPLTQAQQTRLRAALNQAAIK